MVGFTINVSSNCRPPTHRLATIHERNQPTNQRPTNQQRHDTVYRNMRLSLQWMKSLLIIALVSKTSKLLV